ncbi:glycosyltransferase [Alkalihalobacillus sp. LMS39]|uniref:glycosyltransferase n=1 Tax=Alkalihalobacillus sp. LMS39 TaxID=2924032 RepID=UPI001FB2140A|nr:glycosyltransferase [Alkalihalobacillus sp. LMS39]UOE95442.1 glycosyltransferase [Alkalihalobacillus sp. LMS39]
MKIPPIISIIVPIFNVEKYIANCLDSLLNQSLKNIEIILVNDGSSDESGVIAEKYARTDDRIVVIHQKNKGISSARNSGLEIATGQYIGFVDPDDWIEESMYEKLYDVARKTDSSIVFCGFYEFYEDTSRKVEILYPFLSNVNEGKSEVEREILLPVIIGKVHAFTWNKIYKREELIAREIYSPEDLPLMQDIIYNMNVLANVSNVAYINEPLYYFRRHTTSNTMKFRPDIYETIMYIYQEKVLYLERFKLMNETCLREVNIWFVKQVLQVIIAEFNKKNVTSNQEKMARLKTICYDEKTQEIVCNVKIRGNFFQNIILVGLRKRSLPLIGFGARIYNGWLTIRSKYSY